MARLNIDILGINELKWMWMGEFNSENHYIYYCGQEFLRRNGVALIGNKRIWVLRLGAISRMTEWSVCFQGKPLTITVIQVYAPNHDAREAEVDCFYDDLQHLLELIPKKMSFSSQGMECKSRKSRDNWINRQGWPWSTKWSRAKANSFVKRTCWS